MTEEKKDRFEISLFGMAEGLAISDKEEVRVITLGRYETKEEALKDASILMDFFRPLKELEKGYAELYINDTEEDEDEVHVDADPLYTLKFGDGSATKDFIILTRHPEHQKKK